jgi:hypothetical protein
MRRAAPHAGEPTGGEPIVLLTFTGDSIPKILAGLKCGTTRLPSRQWTAVIKNMEQGREYEASIYKGDPRFGGELLFKGKLVRGVHCRGSSFDGEMILKDGFDRKADLAQRLWHHYSKGRVTDPQAVRWFNGREWTWFEWAQAPIVEIHEEQLVQQQLLAA